MRVSVGFLPAGIDRPWALGVMDFGFHGRLQMGSKKGGGEKRKNTGLNVRNRAPQIAAWPCRKGSVLRLREWARDARRGMLRRPDA